ncbi:MAG: transglutaminase-like domain-containing protein [Saprospiraceae bacterium]|nr:transglutaminase-like domain-containing protein [Saprospiraceae bacterium]
MENKELKALISLLDDPDEAVFDQVKKRIEQYGTAVIDDLEMAWENSLDPFFQERIEDLISVIQKSTLREKLQLWLTRNSDDLIQGAILLAKFQYPDINAAEIKEEISKIKQDIWLELNDNLTPLECVNVFNQIFYDTHGFSGNLKNVYNPQNNFIHTVLERRKGSPIMLGIIYQAIANELDLPIFGVDLPFHFVLAYCKYKYSREKKDFYADKDQVIFYINPISNGLMFSKNEIRDYLKRMKIKEEKLFFKPVSNKQVIHTLFLQLSQCYKNNNDTEKVEELQAFIDLFDENYE